MTAALLATIAATEMITGSKDHQPVIQIVVLAFYKLNRFALAAVLSHYSKDKHCARASDPSRRPKAAFEIFSVE